jgi:hypothetical protein
MELSAHAVKVNCDVCLEAERERQSICLKLKDKFDVSVLFLKIANLRIYHA